MVPDARDREEEMRAHLDLYVEQLESRGVAPEEARRQARLKFGNPRAKLEAVADVSKGAFLSAIWRDARYAARVLRRTPVFTATAIATLALVIGANTAVFSLADAILIRSLPYPEPDRLGLIHYTSKGANGTYTGRAVDAAMWEAIRDHVPSVDAAVMGGGGGGANLVIGDAAAFIRQQRVSASFFRVLGVVPERGRPFLPEEDLPGGPPVTVLSDAIWQRFFHADPSIIGQSILLRGEPYTVVGVMPADFVSTRPDVDVWTPLRPSRNGEGSGTNYQTIVRLKPGATWTQVRGELSAAKTEAFALLGQPKGTERDLGVESMQEGLAEGIREPIVMLSWAVAAVLLIACVNLAALLLARGGSRSKEIATRMALGSGRGAVIRQLMVEAAVLALAGGAAGLVVAQFGLSGLKLLGSDTFEEWGTVSLNGRVLGMTLGLSLITSFIFGLVPAIQASRLNVQLAIVSGGTRSIAGSSKHWPRRLLVVAEVALGVVLLVTAGLLVRTFVNLRNLDPGFEPDGLVTASVSLQDARYLDAASVNRLFDESLRRLRETPGIESAAVSLELPYDRLLNSGYRFMDDAAAQPKTTNQTYITPGFLETMRIPVKQGRDIFDTDTAAAPPIALVNETFARVYSKGRAALGRRIRIGNIEREIVGITGDVKQRRSFSGEGIEDGPIVSLPLVFVPAAQTSDGTFRTAHTWFAPVWSVRARDIGAAGAALRAAIAGADARLPVTATRPMSDVMAAAMSEQRLLMTLVGVLAGVALLLASIGIHGLIAHAVTERRREFGIRMALGATSGQTVRDVALGGITLAAAGAVAGGLLSIPAVTLVRSFLWRVETSDPLTYAVAGGGLLIVAAISSLLPALRLLRLDPAATLRA
ncbi:MAG TPA: ABC transporter permease [Vicinamibacterales bacterium]|nr:ABC transporter permease [Vicinamibacterales bacterium]